MRRLILLRALCLCCDYECRARMSKAPDPDTIRYWAAFKARCFARLTNDTTEPRGDRL